MTALLRDIQAESEATLVVTARTDPFFQFLDKRRGFRLRAVKSNHLQAGFTLHFCNSRRTTSLARSTHSFIEDADSLDDDDTDTDTDDERATKKTK